MDLGEGNQLRYVGGNPLVFKKIIIKGTDRTKLSFDCQFMIDIYFVRYRIILCTFQVVGQVLGVGDDIRSVQFFKISVIQKPGGLISELNTLGRLFPTI